MKLWFLLFSCFMCELSAKEISICSGGGLSEEEVEFYNKEAKSLADVASGLGYPLPDNHRIWFGSSNEIAMLATLGRHSYSHWYDGAQLFSALGNISGVLEFVLSGKKSHSYYSSITNMPSQISIIAHVIGHNHFAIESAYHLMAENSLMQDSLRLEKELNLVSDHIDKHEISNFFQMLYSLEEIQDFVFGSYRGPENYEAKGLTLEQIKTKKMKLHKKQGDPFKGITNPNTPSIFSALLGRFGKDLPKWKYDLLRLKEMTVRGYSGAVATKIINEGWATFSQILLSRNSDWYKRADVFPDVSSLMAGVAWRSIENPYWLGLECWENLYKQHKEAGDYQDTSSADKAFVAKASKIIGSTDNVEFITSALDEEWVRKNKFILVRKATDEEVFEYCSKSGKNFPKENEEAYIALSRNYKRIIHYIARKRANRTTIFPYLLLKEFREDKYGAVRIEHVPFDNVPLALVPTVKSLFVLASVFERNFMLDSIIYPWEVKDISELVPHKLRLTVKTDGKLVVESDLGAEASLTAQVILQKELNAYREDLDWSSKTIMDPIVNQVRTTAIKQATALGSKSTWAFDQGFSSSTIAPNANISLAEYIRFIKDRFAFVVQRAVQGKIANKKGKDKVSFRILPEIPSIGLDMEVKKLLVEIMPPAPVDKLIYSDRSEVQPHQDDASFIAENKILNPGDIFYLPKKSAGKGGGNGGKSNLNDIDISIEDWGRLLSQAIKLPNLRSLAKGKNKAKGWRRCGWQYGGSGRLHMLETAKRAFAYGKALGGLPKDASMYDCMESGFQFLDPQKYAKVSALKKSVEDNRAVVVIAVDMSGSMQMVHERVVQLVYSLRALLLSQYKDLKFRYIAYDTGAQEVSEDDLIGSNPKFLGGGTSNAAGYKLAKKVLDEYSYNGWNKYFISINDAGAGDGAQVLPILDAIYKQVEFMSYVFTDSNFYTYDDFLDMMRGFAIRHEHATFAELDGPGQADILKTLSEMFRVR